MARLTIMWGKRHPLTRHATTSAISRYCKVPNGAAASLYAETKSQNANPGGGPERAGFYKRAPDKSQALHTRPAQDRQAAIIKGPMRQVIKRILPSSIVRVVRRLDDRETSVRRINSHVN